MAISRNAVNVGPALFNCTPIRTCPDHPYPRGIVPDESHETATDCYHNCYQTSCVGSRPRGLSVSAKKMAPRSSVKGAAWRHVARERKGADIALGL